VNTSSSAWAFELGQLEAGIRESLGALAPARIRFAPGPLPEAGEEVGEEARPAPVEVSLEDRARGAQLAGGIADENLRKVVARAAAASLARARADRSV